MIPAQPIGIIVTEPDLRYNERETAILEFVMKCPRESNDGFDYLFVQTYGKKAENGANYLSKGREITAIGSLILVESEREKKAKTLDGKEITVVVKEQRPVLRASNLVYHRDGMQGRRAKTEDDTTNVDVSELPL